MHIQLMPEFTQIRPSASPGLCYLCKCTKRSDEEGVISTAVDIPLGDRGLIEICEGDVVQMAAKFGMISADNAKELRANNRRLGLQVKSLEKRLAALQDFIDVERAGDHA